MEKIPEKNFAVKCTLSLSLCLSTAPFEAQLLSQTQAVSTTPRRCRQRRKKFSIQNYQLLNVSPRFRNLQVRTTHNLLTAQIIESGNKEEIKNFYSTNFSEIYKIFLDHLQALDTAAKAKSTLFMNHQNSSPSTEKTIDTKDVLLLSHILLNLMKHARNVIQKRWQQRSISTHPQLLPIYSFSFSQKFGSVPRR